MTPPSGGLHCASSCQCLVASAACLLLAARACSNASADVLVEDPGDAICPAACIAPTLAALSACLLLGALAKRCCGQGKVLGRHFCDAPFKLKQCVADNTRLLSALRWFCWPLGPLPMPRHVSAG